MDIERKRGLYPLVLILRFGKAQLIHGKHPVCGITLPGEWVLSESPREMTKFDQYALHVM